MANRLQKSAGLGAQGASLGTMFAPGIGTVIGGGLGALAGLFAGNDKEVTSPLFSDINLQTENPELYNQLQQYKASLDQYQKLYNARAGGILPSEKRAMDQQASSVAEQQAGLGILGSSQGNRQQAEANAILRDQIAQRAFQEQQGMAGQLASMQGNQYNMTNQALQQAMNARMGQFNNQQADLQSSNQFYGGMLTGGLQGLASGINANRLGGLYDRLYPSGTNIGGGYMGNFTGPSSSYSSSSYLNPLQYGVPGQQMIG
jgi:hypothetical protein